MEILEFGNKQNKKIILIHGLQSPYQILDNYIEYYKNDYYIIVPILPGHNPNKKQEFINFEQISKEIEDYYLKNHGNNVYAIYGMSMGGVVATHLLERKKLNISKLILDSSPLIGYNKFISFCLTKSYLILTHKAQKRDKKTISMAIKYILPEDKVKEFLEMIDNITDTTIINYVKEMGNYKLPPNINISNTDIYYYYGSKINEFLSKKTAKYLNKYYPNSKLICFKGKGHCENSLLNPKFMIKELNKTLMNNKTVKK